eukprot:5263892-Pyramimonas_sp.AAC.1
MPCGADVAHLRSAALAGFPGSHLLGQGRTVSAHDRAGSTGTRPTSRASLRSASAALRKAEGVRSRSAPCSRSTRPLPSSATWGGVRRGLGGGINGQV